MKSSYYIFKNGRLKRKDNTVFFETEDDRKVLPINDIADIYILGEVDFNTKALNFLGKNHICIHLFDYYGNYTSSLYPREYLLSGFLITKQVSKYTDTVERLIIAKALIESASYNILKNLKYYESRKGNLDTIISTIEVLRKDIGKSKDIGQLMSVEGRIREHYYRAFPIITDNKYEFNKRVKNPPDNAMNALISFGNALIYTAVLREIYHTQLNPTVSFLHEPGVRRFSLSLDLSEVFKPLIADRIIFSIMNSNQLNESHFTDNLNFCHLNETGKKIFLKAFDEKMNTTIQHRKLNKKVSYKSLIRIECYKLVKHISDIEEYEGFKAWW